MILAFQISSSVNFFLPLRQKQAFASYWKPVDSVQFIVQNVRFNFLLLSVTRYLCGNVM